MGLRLDGAPLAADRPGEMLTEGVSLGALQVPGDGRPIVSFVEHQTTGGYPQIACVIAADLHRIGQLRARDGVRFVEVSLAEADAALRRARGRPACAPRGGVRPMRLVLRLRLGVGVAVADARRRHARVDARRDGRDVLRLRPHRDPRRVLALGRGGRRARLGDLAHVGDRRDRVRGPGGPHRPRAVARLVDPHLLRVHGAHGDGALPRGTHRVAIARRHRPRRRMGRGIGPGVRELARRAPRQGDRADAVGVGDRLHLRRAAGLRDPPGSWLEGAVRHRRGAGVAGLVGAADGAGAGDLAARRAERSARVHGALSAAAGSQRRGRDLADVVPAVRVLGPVHLGPGVPGEPGGRRRRGDGGGALGRVDRPDADRGVLRVRAVRRARGPLRPPAGLLDVRPRRRGARARVRPDGRRSRWR